MPVNSTEESVALDGFQREGGGDEVGHAVFTRTDEISVSSPDPESANTVSRNHTEVEVDFFRIQKTRNQFTDSRNFVRQLCDASLLAANVSQLRAVLDNGSENSYFIPLLVMIVSSIVFHVVFGILMIQRWRKEREAQMEHKENVMGNPQGMLCSCSPCMKVERYDEISMYFVFLVVILNIIIAALGLSGPEQTSS
uniref:Ninjurin-1-like n=1 Tax=Crassostrea virginica TaxID=6565 RepID=A0A8B8AB38_CRAVI|nr:ninjurin-1-like [Crassostrea virginica]